VRVALTFDTEHPDRPCSGKSLGHILSTLAETGIRATFFVQGHWARSFPDDARAIVETGHLVGNHSHHHAPMDALTDEGFAADVREAEEALIAFAGADPRPWFRCPFGAGMKDPGVLRRLEALGYRHVGWDVDPRDWSEAEDAAGIEAAVTAGVIGDAIVLMHSWPDATAAALPRVVERLTSRGAEFVTVEALAG
jgi:peptidoglycan-N-acetylglucosamine deacetylase